MRACVPSINEGFRGKVGCYWTGVVVIGYIYRLMMKGGYGLKNSCKALSLIRVHISRFPIWSCNRNYYFFTIPTLITV